MLKKTVPHLTVHPTEKRHQTRPRTRDSSVSQAHSIKLNSHKLLSLHQLSFRHFFLSPFIASPLERTGTDVLALVTSALTESPRHYTGQQNIYLSNSTRHNYVTSISICLMSAHQQDKTRPHVGNRHFTCKY